MPAMAEETPPTLLGNEPNSKSDKDKAGIPGTLSSESRVELVTTRSGLVKPGPLSSVQRGFWVAVTVFLPLRFVTKDEGFAEDIIDILHSAYAAVWGVRLTKAVEWVKGYEVALLPNACKSRAQEFFGRSIGYFLADLCYVIIQLARGHVPHLAAGRIAHHIVQSAACFPAILGEQEQTSASCTYLSIAYLAEISNMFLRTNNLLKRLGAQKHPLWMTNFRLLLTTFFLGRIVNFPFCTFLMWRHRKSLPKSVLMLQIGMAQAGMALNVGWFAKLFMTYLKVRKGPMQLL
eukprot:TRINITY_DN22209_c1_g1_i3.p1 TRINITY_DN22209_c1_g1~~TRINITY_DN22209_c1_g1_i3.p1  ORF type:complete len:298 (+),score=37.39 TRINITY_DN22209_c1_g1_i3:27-896(+)